MPFVISLSTRWFCVQLHSIPNVNPPLDRIIRCKTSPWLDMYMANKSTWILFLFSSWKSNIHRYSFFFIASNIQKCVNVNMNHDSCRERVFFFSYRVRVREIHENFYAAFHEKNGSGFCELWLLLVCVFRVLHKSSASS